MSTPTPASAPGTDEKRRRLAELLAKKVGPRTAPASFAQQRVWFLSQLEPESAAYNVPLTFLVHGPLDAEALERALVELVRRHEALRTRLTAADGEPVQVVEPTVPFRLEREDVSDHPGSERDRQVEARARALGMAAEPFDLARAPLLRARLFALGPQQHVLTILMHHVVMDGWSQKVMLGELMALYGAFAEGRPSPLPPVALQYADYAVWQRRHLQGETLEAQVAFWKERLAGAPALLELPTDRARPPLESHEAASRWCRMQAEGLEGLPALVRREGATPFMLFLSLYAAVLGRWSGQETVVVGTPIAGRTRQELEGVVGFFANTLAIPVRLEGDPTFRQLLGQVRRTMLEAHAHQELPFEKLVEELGTERSLAYAPVYQAMFTYSVFGGGVDEDADGPMAAGARFELMTAGAGNAIADLSLSVAEAVDGYVAQVDYRPALFGDEVAERLVRQVGVLARAVAVDPDRPVSSYALVHDEERTRLVEEWSGRAVEYPRDVAVHRLFEQVAVEQPDAVALTAGDGTLTYAELNAHANRLARRLRAIGVVPGARVGLAAERSAETVVALLAILKAGAAYVPLDASYPAARLAFMAADAGISALVVGDAVPEALASFAGPVLSLIGDAEAIGRESSADLGDVEVGPESPAYVIYTSGSTGRPKGVAVPHRAVVRLVRGADYADFGPEQVFLQLAPVAFDASTLELWGPLLNGGRLAVFPPHTPSLEELGRFVREQGVTTLWLTAGLFHQMVDAGLGSLQGVKQLLAGGDVLSVAHVRRALEALPGTRLINGYGPTENTTFTCCHTVRAEDLERGSIPIGRPIASTRVYVLDEQRQPVPVGVPGELYTGGDGVALGYLGQPELTAEKFVADPFSSDADAKLYRTGDRVRWLGDGTLEFLGRIDGQVKVRGFRIETGEIEAVLGAQAGVRDAAVVAREDVPGDRRLVGYVVPQAGVEIDTAAVREGLRASLPEYMVPSAIVTLDALPLTPNGKVDRRALPAPEFTSAAAAHVAPRTDTEERLAAIWAEVLGQERISAEAHFFEAGGHSLLATRVVSRIRQAFELELPLRALFEAPTLAGLAARIDVERGTAAADAVPPLVAVERDGPLPLSFAQERLWFVDRLVPGNPAYNIPAAFPLPETADVAVLERALGEVVRRHEALRTVFAPREEGAVQVIRPAGDFRLEVVELASRSPEERRAEVERIMAREYARPYDLERGPLFRAVLLRGGVGEQVLLLNMHHIVSDGWSMEVLTREVSTLYEAFSRGEPSPLPELPIQYADFAAWQRAWLHGEVLDRQLDYWKGQLTGAPALLELPTDRPRPAVQGYAGSMVPIAISRPVSEGLAALAAREGATPFMVLLAAFNVLLSRWSGQTDIVVGSPIAGRNRAEIEGLIGFFVNNLVLRTDLSDEPTFRQLVARVRETTLGAYAHQEVPFEKLVEALHAERSLSHTPLFQVMFALQNTGEAGGASTGDAAPASDPMQAEDGEGPMVGAKFDLTLNLTETGNGLVGWLEFSTDLFDHATIRRLARHFRALVEAAAGAPDLPVSRLSMLPARERAQVVEEWNAETRRPEYERAVCVHQLFERQAARTPEETALVFGSDRLTYAELNGRANRLARHLRSLGVGPDVLVGVCMERTAELIVSLLAVLKAGGAYVPVDPAYPAERIGYMLEDTCAPVLLTNADVAARLPSTSATVVRVDAEWEQIASRYTTDDLGDVAVRPENLAYCIYTSGSTGRPKGVAIEHRNTAIVLQWLRDEVSDEERRSVLGSTSVSFDVSIAEIFGTLCWGGTLVLVENALSLASLPEGVEVTCANMVPSAAAELLRMGAIPASLRMLLLGGEPLPNPLAQSLYALGTVERVGNGYGPTEDTTYSTYSLVGRGAARVLIGRPVANAQAYVLDAHLQPVPVGVPGELYMAGDGVTRGYLNRPALTAERYVPDPFSTQPGGRMYRVGDLVRWLADGTLEYLGRIDGQVKVRGFRIETGEIESALAAHPAVRQAAVVAREDAAGERRLVGYVVAEPGAEIDTAVLRDGLRTSLPEYMVPSAIVTLDALPLTPNGKLDRRALPAPEFSASAAVYVAPRTETEERLAAIWAEVLGTERVSADAHFFELGGHSLLATRVASRIRQVFGLELPLRALFEAPTLAALAARIDAEAGMAAADEAPPLVPVGRDSPLPLSFAQERLWFVDRLVPGSTAYNLPVVLGLSRAEPAVLERTLGEIVRRHEALRTVFREAEGRTVQVVHPAGEFRLAVVDLAHLPPREREAEAERLVAAEHVRPFDLEQGPLFRATLLRLGGDGEVLILNMHHIVSDGWSTEVLKREVTALYDAFSRGQPSPLPELPVQYADFAVWQREHLRGEVLDRQLAWWKEQLTGAPALLELPTDRPRPAVQSFNGSVVPVVLPRAAADALAAVAAREGATPFMVLLAAFNVLLARWSGQTDIVVGSPIAGRNRAEIEGLIGFFVNNLVLRTDLSDEPTFRQLVARVRETTLGAYAHQEVPFEKLVEALHAERSLSHTPLFQVMFALQNTGEAGSAAAPGFAADAMETEDGAGLQVGAKFDLTLNLAETADGWAGGLEFNTDLFDRATARSMARHFRALVQALAAGPDQPVSRPSLLLPAERARVLDEWNDTGTAERPAECVHQLFAAQAARTPHAVALRSAGESLGYAALDARANRLAHALRARGVGPEVRVGVCLERTPELVVALLAVLKAGGTYVPLDPAHPAERLALLLEDAGIRVLVAGAQTADRLAPHGAAVLRPDADADEIARQPASDPAAGVGPAHAAYVIYTSGSTGTPKGVVVEHGALAAHVLTVRARYGLTADDRVLHFAAAVFDPSLEQLLPALCCGAAVVLRGDEVWSPTELAAHLAAEGVTVANLPTAYWHQAAAAWEAAGELPGHRLRLVIAGGERMAPEALSAWRRGPLSGVALRNAYGPTEATITATLFELPTGPEGDGAAERIRIGRPLPGRRAYVLDPAGQPLPAGVPGELCLGGCLARGYLGHPALSARAFVPDPFSGEPGARLYRTGDRVRWLADGTLEFLGRIDQQVKIRGFRIEPGEVEAVLGSHPGVGEAAVVARADAVAGLRLVAYLVPREGAAAPDAAELRAHLRARLPEYMVPAALVALDALPLTSTGKLDRRALPVPPAEGEAAGEAVAPRSETEEALAAIWAEVLGLERVGVTANFFELGGHSLLLARMQAAVRESLGREVPMVELFRFPTVRSLAAHLAGEAEDGATPERGRDRAEARRAARTTRRERPGR